MRLVTGRHPVEALLDVRPRTVHKLSVANERDPLVDRARKLGVKVEVLAKDRLSSLVKTEHHQGFVAECEPYAYASLDDVLPAEGPALVLALDSVQDPHNLGALVRSAECLGATGIVIPQDRAAEVTAVVAQTSAGAVERIAIARVVNLVRALEELKEKGLWVTGLAGEGPDDLTRVDLTGPTVLVVGAEGDGLRPLVRKNCDRLAHIDLAGKTGSLNASVAGGVALFEARRQRLSKGPR